jgi:hypothetical protein
MGFLLVIVLCCICAGLSSSIASTKGWGAFNWLVSGFLFGPLGLIAAAGLPDRKLQHYLLELSKQNGISPESLELDPVESIPQVGPGNVEEHDFKTDPLTSEEELWDLVLRQLPFSKRDRADRRASKLTKNSSTMIIRSSEGQYLIEARRIHTTRDGVVFWKLIDRS